MDFDPSPLPLNVQQGSPEEMNRTFHHCRANKWNVVLQAVSEKPWLATTLIVMDNHISTTIIHQAITSKGDTVSRANVIRQILKATPNAAAIKNGYGSLPLHVITQRNTKIKSNIKETLIRDFVYAYPGALYEEGGTGRRTPLHIIFTDYISPALTKLMIEQGPQACYMKDKKGWLPAHVACSRHCSPEKLRMLLEVNPDALYEQTNNGEDLLQLATGTATKSHPNFALIDEIQRQKGLLPRAPVVAPVVAPGIHSPHPVNDAASASTPGMLSEDSDGSMRGRLDSGDSGNSWSEHHYHHHYWGHETQGNIKKRSSRKRKLNENNASEALLLLSRDKHFQDFLEDDDSNDRPMQVARV